jgi:hypothetical protein
VCFEHSLVLSVCLLLGLYPERSFNKQAKHNKGTLWIETHNKQAKHNKGTLWIEILKK